MSELPRHQRRKSFGDELVCVDFHSRLQSHTKREMEKILERLQTHHFKINDIQDQVRVNRFAMKELESKLNTMERNRSSVLYRRTDERDQDSSSSLCPSNFKSNLEDGKANDCKVSFFIQRAARAASSYREKIARFHEEYEKFKAVLHNLRFQNTIDSLQLQCLGKRRLRTDRINTTGGKINPSGISKTYVRPLSEYCESFLHGASRDKVEESHKSDSDLIKRMYANQGQKGDGISNMEVVKGEKQKSYKERQEHGALKCRSDCALVGTATGIGPRPLVHFEADRMNKDEAQDGNRKEDSQDDNNEYRETMYKKVTENINMSWSRNSEFQNLSPVFREMIIKLDYSARKARRESAQKDKIIHNLSFKIQQMIKGDINFTTQSNECQKMSGLTPVERNDLIKDNNLEKTSLVNTETQIRSDKEEMLAVIKEVNHLNREDDNLGILTDDDKKFKEKCSNKEVSQCSDLNELQMEIRKRYKSRALSLKVELENLQQEMQGKDHEILKLRKVINELGKEKKNKKQSTNVVSQLQDSLLVSEKNIHGLNDMSVESGSIKDDNSLKEFNKNIAKLQDLKKRLDHDETLSSRTQVGFRSLGNDQAPKKERNRENLSEKKSCPVDAVPTFSQFDKVLNEYLCKKTNNDSSSEIVSQKSSKSRDQNLSNLEGEESQTDSTGALNFEETTTVETNYGNDRESFDQQTGSVIFQLNVRDLNSRRKEEDSNELKATFYNNVKFSQGGNYLDIVGDWLMEAEEYSGSATDQGDAGKQKRDTEESSLSDVPRVLSAKTLSRMSSDIPMVFELQDIERKAASCDSNLNSCTVSAEKKESNRTESALASSRSSLVKGDLSFEMVTSIHKNFVESSEALGDQGNSEYNLELLEEIFEKELSEIWVSGDSEPDEDRENKS